MLGGGGWLYQWWMVTIPMGTEFCGGKKKFLSSSFDTLPLKWRSPASFLFWLVLVRKVEFYVKLPQPTWRGTPVSTFMRGVHGVSHSSPQRVLCDLNATHVRPVYSLRELPKMLFTYSDGDPLPPTIIYSSFVPSLSLSIHLTAWNCHEKAS